MESLTFGDSSRFFFLSIMFYNFWYLEDLGLQIALGHLTTCQLE